VEHMKCKQDGGNVCNGLRLSLYILLISCDQGHMDSRLILG